MLDNITLVVSRWEREDMSLEAINLLGTILAGVGYGMTVVLFFISLGAFWKRQPRMRPFKIISWALWLLILATVCLAFQIQWTLTADVTNRDYPGGSNRFIQNNPGNWVNVMVNTLYVILTWTSDLTILHRFWHVWHTRRCVMIAPCVLLLTTIITGSFSLYKLATPGDTITAKDKADWSIVYRTISLSFNVILTCAIILRIYLVSRDVRKHRVPQTPWLQEPYFHVITMLTESASLETAVGLVYIITVGLNSPLQNAFLPILGQVQVISPMLIIYRVASGRAWKKDTLQVALSGPEFYLPTTAKEGKTSMSPDIPDRSTASLSPFFSSINGRRSSEKLRAGFGVECWSNRDQSIHEVKRHSRSLSADQYSMARAPNAQPTVTVSLAPNGVPSSPYPGNGSSISIAGDNGSDRWLSSPLYSEPFQCHPPTEYRTTHPHASLGIDTSCLTVFEGAEPSNSPSCGESSRSSGSQHPLLPKRSFQSSFGDELTPTHSSITFPSSIVIEKPSSAKLPPPHSCSLRNARSWEGLTREAGGTRGRAYSVDSQNRKVTRQTWPASCGS